MLPNSLKRSRYPRVWKDINRTLSKLNRAEEIDYDYVKSLFSDIRQLLEACRLQSRFPALNFFCNLLQHSELSRGNSLLPLQVFAKILNNQRVDDWGAGGSLNLIGWPALVRDGARILDQFQLDPRIFQDQEFGYALRVALLESTSGKPIHAEELIGQKKGEDIHGALNKHHLTCQEFAVWSFEIIEWESETRLQVFYLKFTLLRLTDFVKVNSGAAPVIGRCLICGSHRVGPIRPITDDDISRLELPNIFCRGCGTRHNFDPWGDDSIWKSSAS